MAESAGACSPGGSSRAEPASAVRSVVEDAPCPRLRVTGGSPAGRARVPSRLAFLLRLPAVIRVRPRPGLRERVGALGLPTSGADADRPASQLPHGRAGDRVEPVLPVGALRCVAGRVMARRRLLTPLRRCGPCWDALGLRCGRARPGAGTGEAYRSLGLPACGRRGHRRFACRLLPPRRARHVPRSRCWPRVRVRRLVAGCARGSRPLVGARVDCRLARGLPASGPSPHRTVPARARRVATARLDRWCAPGSRRIRGFRAASRGLVGALRVSLHLASGERLSRLAGTAPARRPLRHGQGAVQLGTARLGGSGRQLVRHAPRSDRLRRRPGSAGGNRLGQRQRHGTLRARLGRF